MRLGWGFDNYKRNVTTNMVAVFEVNLNQYIKGFENIGDFSGFGHEVKMVLNIDYSER